jgi:SAM-dependent methyltransferase
MDAYRTGYASWRTIAYNPAVPELSLDNLTPYLRRSQRALEIGCNQGRAAFWLHRHGLDVLGIDINPDAVFQAQVSAQRLHAVRFMEADFLTHPDLGKFDLVVMIRVLTCFPQLDDWRTALNRSFECLEPGGMLYVHDFLMVPESDSYRDRYCDAAQRGWRHGNLAVPAKDGSLLFVAHHHSPEDLAQIMAPYEKIFLNLHDSLSLHGNPCRMFEFLATRKE